jgi:D-cysteine desulfhydrase
VSLLGDRYPAADLPHVRLGTGPTPVRRLEGIADDVDLWIKDEGAFGDGAWGGTPRTR